MGLELVPRAMDKAVVTLPRENGTVTIGRSDECTVRFSQSYISRTHARFLVENSRTFLVPKSSDASLILVNDRPTIKGSRVELQVNDIVSLVKDNTEFVYDVRGAAPLTCSEDTTASSSSESHPPVIVIDASSAAAAVVVADDAAAVAPDVAAAASTESISNDATSTKKRRRSSSMGGRAGISMADAATSPPSPCKRRRLSEEEEEETSGGGGGGVVVAAEEETSGGVVVGTTTTTTMAAPPANDEEGWRDYECIICYGLIAFCHVLNCGHAACAKCLNEWLVIHSQCPVCSKKVEANACIAPVLMVDSAIEQRIESLSKEDLEDWRKRKEAWKTIRPPMLRAPCSAVEEVKPPPSQPPQQQQQQQQPRPPTRPAAGSSHAAPGRFRGVADRPSTQNSQRGGGTSSQRGGNDIRRHFVHQQQHRGANREVPPRPRSQPQVIDLIDSDSNNAVIDLA